MGLFCLVLKSNLNAGLFGFVLKSNLNVKNAQRRKFNMHCATQLIGRSSLGFAALAGSCMRSISIGLATLCSFTANSGIVET